MKNRSRTARIFISLIASMTIGSLVLMALDGESMNAGAFSLASYTRLNSIEDAAENIQTDVNPAWVAIEVFYSDTSAGHLEQLARQAGLDRPEDLNTHFVVCNGDGRLDGLIQCSQRWRDQKNCTRSSRFGHAGVIRICVISDGIATKPTDSQLQRTASLVETLCRTHHIRTDRVHYPANWEF